VRVVRTSLLAIVIGLVALAAAACDQIPTLIAPPGDPIVQVELRGGLCPEGACQVRLALAADGTISRSDGTSHRLDAGTMGRVAAAIGSADWDAILATPFEGTCPVAFDGSEAVWTVRTSRGVVTVASCTTLVDSTQEPWQTLERALFAPGG